MPNEATFARRAWVEIDLAALERNLGKIKAALPSHVRYVAVVKADAYGHGAGPTVSRLLQCGVDCFAVANVREGADVREIGPGADILVLSAVLPEEVPWLAEHGLTAAISSKTEASALAAFADQKKCRLPVHVKVDTGMGRMGVWHKEAPELFEHVLALDSLDLRGIFTHFSSADTDAAFTAGQRALFLEALAAAPSALWNRGPLLIHADNSAGLESFSADSPFNAVRVGLLQYGLPPYRESLLARLKPEPVLSFHSRVGLVKTLPRGATVSYNRTHTLTRDSRIAVITAGYGDGIPLAASNRAQVLVRGRRCPVLGRVTMDQTVVDVSDLPDVAIGDIATLIGPQAGSEISVSEFCAWTGTIPWEVFCSITKRVERVYRTMRIQ
jgi:alanine racemase